VLHTLGTTSAPDQPLFSLYLFSFADVVRVRYLLPERADFEPCWPVLRRYFGEVRPAATMMVCGLADPRTKIEIEVSARWGSGV
jgi:enamine deaminase RidA (YjgF/YER057c/UK114 family)